jgi:2-phospho-L-lactate guanylyltransferase
VSTFAILPIKAFDDAKSRLATACTPETRATLAQAMCRDVLIALQASTQVARTLVVTRDALAAALARTLGAHVIPDRSASHSQAVTQGVAFALAHGATRTLMVAGDCPLLTVADLDAVLASAAVIGRSVTVVPDRDGAGTNALVLTPPDVITPSFGPGSHARHLELAHGIGADGITFERTAFAYDVDTPEDLQAVVEALTTRPVGAENTRMALHALGIAARA